MNKAELARQIAGKMDIPRAEAMRYIETLKEVFAETFQRDENIVIQNFGSFSLWKQTERPGRNPRTGEQVVINARKSIKFKPGQYLLDRLNGGKPEEYGK